MELLGHMLWAENNHSAWLLSPVWRNAVKSIMAYGSVWNGRWYHVDRGATYPQLKMLKTDHAQCQGKSEHCIRTGAIFQGMHLDVK